MAKDRYMPWAESKAVIWMNNFAANFAAYSTALGFTAADVTALNNDVAMFAYQVNMVEMLTASKQQQVSYKNLLKFGPIGKPGGAPPAAPVVPAPPTTVEPGILPRIASLVRRIKASPTYTEAIGKALGIVGAEMVRNVDTIQPVLKLVASGGSIEVQWTKGSADAIHIEVDRGSGTWQFLAIDSIPHYQDKTPITTPAVWKYRAAYIVKDKRIGQWSAETSIAVG